MSASRMHAPSASADNVLFLLLLVILFLLQSYLIYSLFTSRIPSGNDFYSRWRGTRALLLEGKDPYSEEVTLEIQKGMYGRPARGDEDQVAFAYPLYVSLFILPLAFLPYPQAQALWLSGLVFLTLAAVTITLRTFDWKPSPAGLLALSLWCLLLYPTARSIVLGQFTIPVLALVALALWAVERDCDFLAGCSLALAPLMANITLRLTADPESDAYYSRIQDGAIQTEEAIKFLLEGKNPYVEDYDKTGVARITLPEVSPNPAIYHYVYLPGTFLLSLPFYIGSMRILGWYDQRLVHALAFMIVLLMLPQLARSTERKLSLLVAVGLNFLLLISLAFGMNDVLVLSLLLLSTYLFQRGCHLASTIPLALACATKQVAWFFLPFYFLLQFNGSFCLGEIGSLIKKTYPFFLTFALVVLPFFLWNPAAFIDDTFSYVSGISPTSYPIRGFGVGALLLACGVIKSNTAYFPFWILQLIFGLPLLIYLLRKQLKENNVSRCWLGYGIFLAIMAFLSRYFHINHLGYAIAALSIGLLVDLPSITTPAGVGKGTQT